MLFHVTMQVSIPHRIDPVHLDTLKQREKARCHELMEAGIWRHIWRVVGAYRNISIFDVADAATLHDLLIDLPLFPFMEIIVVPLCHHPSSIREDDR